MLAGYAYAHLAVFTVIIAVAYFVRGVAGFGSGLIAIPLLLLYKLPLLSAVPMVVLLDYLASAGQGVKNRAEIRWREVAYLLPFSLLGVGLAVYLFTAVEAAALTGALAVFIVVYGAYTVLVNSPPRGGSRAWAGPAGAFGGLIGTLFGTGGPFYVAYLHARGLEKSAFRATFACIFLLDGASRLGAYIWSGFYNYDSMLLIGLMLPVMALSLYAGGHVHVRISQTGFKRTIGLLLVVSGAVLSLK